MQFSTITLIAAIAGTTFAAPHDLEPRIDCSSAACQTLVDEASCFIDAGANIIKIFQCLDAAGGVSSVCPCIACVPEVGDFLSQPGIC